MTEDFSAAHSKIGIEVKLETGAQIFLRPMSPKDKALIAEAIREMSPEARKLRFFYGFQEAPEVLLNLLADVDGVTHIGWGALDVSGPDPKPIGGVHAVRVVDGALEAEIACSVVDAYQRHGLARILLAAVFHECLVQGIQRGVVDVLSSNQKALHLFRGLGAKLVETGETQRLSLDIHQALIDMKDSATPPEIVDVVAYLDRATGQID